MTLMKLHKQTYISVVTVPPDEPSGLKSARILMSAYYRGRMSMKNIFYFCTFLLGLSPFVFH